MKTIGLIGGMSWESTAHYYAELNQGIKKALGGLHSARILLYSVDFGPIEKLQNKEDWESLGNIMADAARKVEKGGADCLLICTNTMHKLTGIVEDAVNIPLLHIADATAQVLVHDKIKRVGLLGTAYTMEQEFYKNRLISKFDLDVIIPDEKDRNSIHTIIYKELCLGQIKTQSQKTYLNITKRLAEKGAQGIILGCTEIGMLLKPEDIDIPLYDTAKIHAAKAVEWALKYE
ncbi:MAG: aspartate/glutamate racemase family protein [Desulfobacula sp.]|uniref:aspartate/glutamate racemase family protein n=1 Tax=Desulfobacula sp. TaxID=2593537 RepID=UPI0025BE6E40|nr:aspartate/glutamate racemase family protein [Desulfobacula sp.]MCD4721869.1 aspartate/glutamate racemase family protein [Desulfobacula sp.]